MRQAAIPFWSPAEVESSLVDTVAHLQAGKVLAYPTETVYGFGGAVSLTAICLQPTCYGLIAQNECRRASACAGSTHSSVPVAGIRAFPDAPT